MVTRKMLVVNGPNAGQIVATEVSPPIVLASGGGPATDPLADPLTTTYYYPQQIVLFDRLLTVLATGGNTRLDNALAWSLLKPEVFELWKAGHRHGD